MATTRTTLHLDTPHGPLAATFAPASGGERRPLLVCVPGGTYTRDYFDLHVPDDPTYSFVDHANAAGWSTLCIDPLGTGDSARPTDRDITRTDQAAALAHALTTLPDHVRSPEGAIGVGHSMGGHIIIRQQARHGGYHGLTILGSTIDAVAPLQLPDALRESAKDPEARTALIAQFASAMPDAYLAATRDDMMSWFHLDDVPAHVRAADLTTLTVVPRGCAAEGTVPFNAIEDAAAIDIPVLLAFGSIDVAASPHDEPAFYRASNDISLFLLRNSAHCHNTASTRHVLWNRILAWSTIVART